MSLLTQQMVNDIIRDGNMFSCGSDGRQSFEGWFQDLQLSVSECFENPESRTDVEIYLQRLAVSEHQCVDQRSNSASFPKFCITVDPQRHKT